MPLIGSGSGVVNNIGTVLRNNETVNMNANKDVILSRTNYLKQFDPVQVRMRYHNQRCPLFDLKMSGITKIHAAKSVDFGDATPMILNTQCNIKQEIEIPKQVEIIQMENYSGNEISCHPPKWTETGQSESPRANDLIKREFHRKIKEAAENSQTCVNNHSPNKGEDIVCPRMKNKVILDRTSGVHKLQENGTVPEFQDQTDSLPLPQLELSLINLNGPNISPSENLERFGTPPVSPNNMKLSNYTSDGLYLDLDSNSQQQIEHDHLCTEQKPGTEIVTENTGMFERRSINGFSMSIFVAEFYETNDWENAVRTIYKSGVLDTSAAHFVYDMVLWAINESDSQLHKTVGCIMRLMLKNDMAEKRKVLELFATKFIDDQPAISGMRWDAVILPRLVRVLEETFFNEGNFDWLWNLRQYSLQNEFCLDGWDELANQFVRSFAARTNMDFVLNLVRQTTPSLPEILPVLRDSAVNWAALVPKASIEAPACPPCPSTQNVKPKFCPRLSHHYSGLPPMSSKDVSEASEILQALQSKEVTITSFNKPLFDILGSKIPPLKDEEPRAEIIRQNLYFLAKLLRHSLDVLVVLQHSGIITRTEKFKLMEISSEFVRFVSILVIIAKKDKKTFSVFLNILKCTDNGEVLEEILRCLT